MTEEQIKKIYALLMATTIKFESITPTNIRDMILQRYVDEDTSPLPVSLQPFTESIKLSDNMIKLTEYIEKIQLEDNDIFKKVAAEFWDMTEEQFIKWYRDSKKSGG